MRRTRDIPMALRGINSISITPYSVESLGPEILGVFNGSTASAVWTANRLIFVPFITAQPVMVSQFFWVNGATAADNTDVGIYDEAGTTKIISTGSTANSGGGVLQSVDVANTLLAANRRYWLALGCDSSTQTFERASLSALAQEFVGIKEQLSGWSGGLPSSITLGAPTLAVLPSFGFTGSSVI